MDWEPKTEFGIRVLNGEITSIDQILFSGRPILEEQIVDLLLPNISSKTIQISPTQRVTDSGRKVSFRALVVVGDSSGYVGVGVGKSEEVGPAISYAEKQAKRNIIKVPKGCGSWECQCGGTHSIPMRLEGKEGTTKVILYPAPKGVNLASNEVIKTILSMAGVKDVWSTCIGSTSNVLNMSFATISALDSYNNLKVLEGA